MKTVSLQEANAAFPALLSQVEQGEDVVIERDGRAVAKLTRVEVPSSPRERGTWRSLPGWRDFQYDPTIFAPMTDKEMVAEGWP